MFICRIIRIGFKSRGYVYCMLE